MPSNDLVAKLSEYVNFDYTLQSNQSSNCLRTFFRSVKGTLIPPLSIWKLQITLLCLFVGYISPTWLFKVSFDLLTPGDPTTGLICIKPNLPQSPKDIWYFNLNINDQWQLAAEQRTNMYFPAAILKMSSWRPFWSEQMETWVFWLLMPCSFQNSPWKKYKNT